jgi:hypothetical protein
MDIPSGLIGIVLLFVDGLIFGVAIKKGFTAVVLIIVGFLLAGFIGFAVPLLTISNFSGDLSHWASLIASDIGVIIYGFPIAWIIGLVVGLVM